ncbi:hypothetical protein [Streptomyces sp. NBC_00989]|uniref:hypothetical protein n=1 Tax=Streptomyces sp. NBC_00989 TaxID=2903705 RepID=UPI003865BF53|nr:hypothetical protein OG714_28800 [Streptomyces sp. NBC_00989]
MTQSGQGEEPSARPAREGIVLPSDGGAPLLPGMTGGRGDHQSGGQPAIAPPAGGQSWGGSWGPDQQQDPQHHHQHQTPAPPPGQGWGEPQQQPQQPAQQWGAAPEQPAPSPWGAQDGIPGQPGALPQESAQHAAYGVQQQSYAQEYPSGYAPEHSAGYVGAGYASDQAPATPQAAGQGYGYGYGADQQSGAHQSSAAALPAAAPVFPSAPLPPADEGATQYIPPVVNMPGDEGATQFLPPVTAAGLAAMDEGATQYIPPVGPGALPPEMPAGPMPQAAHPDAQPTQFLPPVPAQGAAPGYGARAGGPDDRQPPAEFDNLFRSDAGSEQPAGSTQQMPRFQQPPRAEQPGQQGYGQAQPPYAQQGYAQPSYAPPGDGGGRRGAQGDDGGRGGRRSRVPLIAGVGVGIAILGVGAGALLSGGGGKSDDTNKTVAATSAATDGSSSAGTDAAKEQAVALDKLLADSGSSRASVINAVGNVKACNKLGDSASDLRDAAKQRAELVTKLSQLTVDKLPENAALTTALTNAWKASAAADNHYATWADQAAGKHGCKKGQARTTGQTAAGNAASGTASNQKVKASALWNTIAKTYGLTQRQPTQL